MLECVDLSGMPGDSLALQGIWWKVDRLELAVSTNVVRVGSEKEQMVLLKLLQDRKIIVSYHDWWHVSMIVNM